MTSKMGVLTRGTSNVGVLDALHEAIHSGEYQPGSQLKQVEISEKLGVSPGPVREALGRLVEEGLVEMIPYKGMFVRKLTKRDVAEIYEIRIALETLAFRLAFDKLKTPEKLQKLKEILQNGVIAAHSLDGEGVVNADLGFHRFLVEETGNIRLLKMWESLLAQAHNILYKLYELDNGAIYKVFSLKHEIILQSLYDNDPTKGVRLIEEHMEFARDALLDSWGKVIKTS